MHSNNKAAAELTLPRMHSTVSILVRTTGVATEFSGGSTPLHEALPCSATRAL
jgi:hypothetical protein